MFFFVLTVCRPVVMDAGLTQPQCLGCGNNEFQCPLTPNMHRHREQKENTVALIKGELRTRTHTDPT